MALDKDRLGDAFVTTVLDCLGSSPVTADLDKLRELMRALAEDIIVEFENNGIVNTTVSNVQAGGSTANGVGTIT